MHSGGQLAGDDNVYHPNRLNGFPPVPGRICRHPIAHLSDALQFFLRVGSVSRLPFFVPDRHNFGVSDGSIDGNQNSLIEVFLFLQTIVVIGLVCLG